MDHPRWPLRFEAQVTLFAAEHSLSRSRYLGPRLQNATGLYAAALAHKTSLLLNEHNLIDW